ncbi:MAG: type II secretion system protein GspN [Thermodesulfobacteriota bacterium]
MSRTKIVFLYSGYSLLTILFFVYYLFPAEETKNRVGVYLRQNVPELDMDIGDVRPAFPPGLTFRNLGLYYQNQKLLDVGKLKLSVGWRFVLGQDVPLGFQCEAFGGGISGDAVVSLQKPGRFSVEARFADIELQDMAKLKQWIPHELSGKLAGSLLIAADGPMDRSAQTNVRLTAAGIELAEPYYGIDQLTFDEMEAGLTMTNNRLTIDRLKTRGADVDGSITGSIMIRTPVQNSILNLTGEATPQPLLLDKLRRKLPLDALLKNAGKKSIAFRIDGTAQNPKFSLR